MQGDAKGMYGRLCKVLGEYRGMPGIRMGVCACQGIAGECQGNVWQWVQNARGMQGDAKKCQRNAGYVFKVPVECRGMQGNASGTYGGERSARGIGRM